ncbi:hypothetical protein AVEN_59470-1 [Araneus ventricosus]|uniref:Uncharacterized protein n=1 Tax=Araneus ventricosus TaxID=182803 RepID=A0A4Y2JGE4_ARAVE|nr:hypothetical protein AVEN_59470-1 [Araneus ventricosus]
MAKIDEAGIYLSDTNAKSKVQYLICDQNRRDLTPSTTVPQPKRHNGLMDISANDTINHGLCNQAKINSGAACCKILKSFLKNDYCKL